MFQYIEITGKDTATDSQISLVLVVFEICHLTEDSNQWKKSNHMVVHSRIYMCRMFSRLLTRRQKNDPTASVIPLNFLRSPQIKQTTKTH